MTALARAGKPERALELWASAQGAAGAGADGGGAGAADRVVAAAVDAYGRHGQPALAATLVRTLEAQGSALADVVYLALLEHTQPGPYTHTESAWAREWVRE
jgi:hypothetical protein